MPKWAAGLSGLIKREGDHWISISPMGKAKVYFSERGEFGVIDHDALLEDGRKFHNPLGVIKNKTAPEVVFTLFKQPEMSEKDFDRDVEIVLSDLKKRKSLLEADSGN